MRLRPDAVLRMRGPFWDRPGPAGLGDKARGDVASPH